jgi:uncharacterized membrane protein
MSGECAAALQQHPVRLPQINGLTGGDSEMARPLLSTYAIGILFVAQHACAAYFAPLGNLPNITGASPSGVSADGSVVVGTGGDYWWWGPSEAFRWTAGSGMVGLGEELAMDVSWDGSVVIGCCYSGQAFRWTSAGGHGGNWKWRSLRCIGRWLGDRGSAWPSRDRRRGISLD